MSRADRSNLATTVALLEQSARSIARHRGRSALSAVGIAVAIAAVVLVVALAREGSDRTSSLLLAVGDNLVWVEAGSRNVAGVRAGTKGSPTLTLDDLILGMLGGVMGVGLSVAGAAALGSTLGWTLHVPIDTLFLALVFAGLVGALFGYLPARHASRLDPIEALRSE